MNAAVLTVSDRVSRGEAEDGSGDLLEELLARRRLRGRAARRPGRGRRDRGRDRRARGAGGRRPDDGRHRARAAGRHARGDAHRPAARGPGIAEALRADSIAKTPHGLLSRGVAGVVGPHAGRQPARLDRRLPRRLRGAAARAEPRARASRRRAAHTSNVSRLPPDARRPPLLPARQVRAHDLRAAVRVRRRVPRRAAACPPRTTCSGSPRDGRRALARDGAQPADRRAHRRREPAYRDARASLRRADEGRGDRFLPARRSLCMPSRSGSSIRSCAGSRRSRWSRSSSIRT